MFLVEYNRQKAVNYAEVWALNRNAKYYNFDSLGGDCTNFVSQCIFAGGEIMNYSSNGWFYKSLNNRAPAWTGVEELYTFLTTNNGIGPFGKIIDKGSLSIGDVIELGRTTNDFYHSLFVSKIIDGRIFVCSHTRDSLNLPLDYYSFKYIRCIKILGFRNK